MRSLGIASALVLCLAPPIRADSPVSAIGAFAFTVFVDSSALVIPYDGNQLLTDPHPQVLRAVVLIPGSNRNSSFGYETLLECATIAGMNDSTSLLVVPQYLIEEDIAHFQLPADHPFWSDDGWKEGNRSQSSSSHPRPVRISSFAVLDSALYAIASRNPNLESIVVAGHSAGGQFVNRYAAGNAVEPALWDSFGVQVSYVSANPSSYLYLDGERPVRGVPGSFGVPDPVSCPDYDQYKYGMQSRNLYMATLPDTQIVRQFAQRRVTYLLGQLDTDPAHPDLDTTCPAELQGVHRLERGILYHDFLSHYYGADIWAVHSTVVVPGVGHDSRGMLTSPCGVVALFGAGSCTAVDVKDWPGATGDANERGWLRCAPDPFRTRTTILFGLPAGVRRATVGVYDLRGRRLRTLESGAPRDGRGSVVWDGRGGSGQRLPAGIYLLRLGDGRTAITKRVALLR